MTTARAASAERSAEVGLVHAALAPKDARAEPRHAALGRALGTALATVVIFLALAVGFFGLLGRAPLPLLVALWEGSFGSGFALSEALLELSPVLLCALGTALPAALGLVSVGAEGQLFMGSIAGTALVLAAGDRLGAATLPSMLIAGACGGAAHAALAGVLRVRLRVNETIGTLLTNYFPPLLVQYLVYGPWKDPDSLGWPATSPFPESARLATYFDTRLHGGLIGAALLVVAAHVLVTRTRFGLALTLLRDSPLLAERAGLSFGAWVLGVMALGGAAAGIAGIIEVSVVEGRLQAGVGAGAGYAGFLVAFLARGRLLSLLPLGLAVSALQAAGDNLQLSLGLPSAVAYVLEGLLFAAALIAQRWFSSSDTPGRP